MSPRKLTFASPYAIALYGTSPAGSLPYARSPTINYPTGSRLRHPAANHEYKALLPYSHDPSKGGRHPINGIRAMTPAERQRRHRAGLATPINTHPNKAITTPPSDETHMKVHPMPPDERRGIEFERDTADSEVDLEQIIRARQAALKNPPPVQATNPTGQITIQINETLTTGLIDRGFLAPQDAANEPAIDAALRAFLKAAWFATAAPAEPEPEPAEA